MWVSISTRSVRSKSMHYLPSYAICIYIYICAIVMNNTNVGFRLSGLLSRANYIRNKSSSTTPRLILTDHKIHSN